MSDDRSVYYTNSYEVSRMMRPNQWQTAVLLSADSGASETNKNRINVSLANLVNFTEGDFVRVYDASDTIGETIQIQDVVPSGPYMETVSDLTGDYETTDTANVQLLSYFVRHGSSGNDVISTIELNRMIEDAEAEIEERTGHAWRAVTVTTESHAYPIEYRTWKDWKDGIPIKLNHRSVKTLTYASGDRINLYEKNTGYVDKLTGWTLDSDYRLDEEKGILYLYKFWKWHERSGIQVTYRYGETTVPNDIRKAATLMVVIQLLEQEHAMSMHPGGGDMNYDPIPGKIDKYQAQADRILRDREEIRFFHR